MKLEELIELFKRDARINFVGMAITPLQVAGIDAAIMYLQSKGVDVRGYILITTHPSTGKSINENDFISNISGIKFIDFEYSFSEKKTFKEKMLIKKKILSSVCSRKGEDIYFAWTETVSNIIYAINEALPDKRIKVIKIDDGAGSYMSSTYLKFSYLQYECNLLKAVFKALAYGYSIRKATRALVRNDSYIDANIFKVSKNRGKMIYIPNEEFAPFYSEAFKKSCVSQENISVFEESIIINTQPLKEMGITDGNIEYSLYSQLTDVIKSTGRKIVLKPHPREQEIERYHKLGWTIFSNNKISQESIFAIINKKPLCLISIYSSTLLNAYGLEHIPVISLAKIMLKEEIPNALRKELKKYINNYNSIVFFPDSFEELSEYIKQLMRS